MRLSARGARKSRSAHSSLTQRTTSPSPSTSITASRYSAPRTASSSCRSASRRTAKFALSAYNSFTVSKLHSSFAQARLCFVPVGATVFAPEGANMPVSKRSYSLDQCAAEYLDRRAKKLKRSASSVLSELVAEAAQQEARD